MAQESPRIARLREQLAGGRPGALDDFWRAVTAAGTPMVEPGLDGQALVTFLWRGRARSVATAWGVSADLDRLPGTDLWHATVRLPVDLHTLYYLRRDGAPGQPSTTGADGRVHVDPHNPQRLRFPADRGDPTDREVWASVLRLPDAPADDWSVPRPGVPRGRMLRHSLASAALGGRRRVWVYRPAGHRRRPAEDLPVLVVLDGYLARSVLRVPVTLDNLVAAGRVPPLVALLVASPNGRRRFTELGPGARMCRFLTGELLPWARRRFPLTTDPARHAVAGVSLGGLAAAYAGRFAPDTFGAVIAQSGGFWWPPPRAGRTPEWLTTCYAASPRLPLRFYLDVGALETYAVADDYPSQVVAARRFRDVLEERGYPVTYTEYTGGHDYVNWRRTFADALVAVLGTAA